MTGANFMFFTVTLHLDNGRICKLTAVGNFLHGVLEPESTCDVVIRENKEYAYKSEGNSGKKEPADKA